MQTDFRIRERGRTVVVSKRTSVRLSTIGDVIGPGFGEIYGFLGSRGITPTEPPFVIYHGMPGPDDPPFEIEVCAPVENAPPDLPAGWTRMELPAGTFASVVHVGPYDTLGAAYDELEAWTGRQGLAIAGPPREVYLSEPSVPAAEIRTVVEFPVETSTAAMPLAIA